jgi:hypothetical protein
MPYSHRLYRGLAWEGIRSRLFLGLALARFPQWRQKELLETMMPDRSNPVFHDVKRPTMRTDVDFFAMDEDIAKRLEESEADRAARLEVIQGLLAERNNLVAERDFFIAERSAAIARAADAERKLIAIRRFVPWHWLPVQVKMMARRLAGL